MHGSLNGQILDFNSYNGKLHSFSINPGLPTLVKRVGFTLWKILLSDGSQASRGAISSPQYKAEQLIEP